MPRGAIFAAFYGRKGQKKEDLLQVAKGSLCESSTKAETKKSTLDMYTGTSTTVHPATTNGVCRHHGGDVTEYGK